MGIELLPAFLLMQLGWFSANHFPPWVSWHSEVPFFVVSAVLGTIAALRPDSRRPTMAVDVPKPAVLCVLLSFVVLVQWSTGQLVWLGQALVGVLYLWMAAFAIAYAYREAAAYTPHSTLSTPRVACAEWLALALVIAAFLSIVLALFQVLEVVEVAPWMVTMPLPRRPGANLAQPNHLATLVSMGAGAVLYLLATHRIRAIVAAAMLTCFSIGIAVTESRTGLLILVCLSVWFAWKYPSRRPALRVSAAFIWVAVSLLLFVAWPLVYRQMFGEIQVVAEGIERLATSSQDPRLLLWGQLLEASMLKPWMGWGFRNTAVAHNAVAHLAAFSMPFTYSHSLPLDLILWFGWPLACLMIGLCVHWALTRVIAIQSDVAWFGMSLIIPLAVHSLFEFPFAYAYLLLPAVLGVGYVEQAYRPQSARWLLPRAAILVPVIAYAVIGLWSVLDYLRAEEDFRTARFEMLRIGKPALEPAPRLMLLDQLRDLTASSRVVLRPDMPSHETRLLELAALHHPWAGTQYRYAAALALNGNSTEANRQLRVLRAQHGSKVADSLREQLNSSLGQYGKPFLNDQ